MSNKNKIEENSDEILEDDVASSSEDIGETLINANTDTPKSKGGFGKAILIALFFLVFGLFIGLLSMPYLSPYIPASIVEKINPNEKKIEEMRSLVDSLSGKFDTSSAKITALEEDSGDLATSIAELDEKLLAITEVISGDEVVDFEAIKLEAETARKEIEELRIELAQQAESERKLKETTTNKSAYLALKMAIETGHNLEAGFNQFIATGMEVPENIQQNMSKIMSLEALTHELDDLSLDAIRAAMTSNEADSLVENIRVSLSALFVGKPSEPIEGVGPDAILSRAIASMEEGNLEATLAELTALPSASKDVLSDWIFKAELRNQTDKWLRDVGREIES